MFLVYCEQMRLFESRECKSYFLEFWAYLIRLVQRWLFTDLTEHKVRLPFPGLSCSTLPRQHCMQIMWNWAGQVFDFMPSVCLSCNRHSTGIVCLFMIGLRYQIPCNTQIITWCVQSTWLPTCCRHLVACLCLTVWYVRGFAVNVNIVIYAIWNTISSIKLDTYFIFPK